MKKRVFTCLFCFVLFAANAQVIGDFPGITPHDQDQLLHIPSTHAFQVISQWGDDLTDGTKMPRNADFTGYVPINGSSTNGHLCVNSEWVPGGVSVFDLQYSATSRLWEITASGSTDFTMWDKPLVIPITIPNLATIDKIPSTAVNCSGGVSPWGTMFTAEEFNTDLGFLAGTIDGYLYFGWLIEVDPVTRTVIDHDNDGDPDKLWAMGNMKHENVTFVPDSLTAYYGDDNQTTGFVFKFVADQKTKFSSGSLYVLKLDTANVSQGTWVQLPNSTVSERNGTITAAENAGATKFDRVEDVEVGPDGKVYVVSTGQDRIFRFRDDGSTVSSFEIYVDNVNYVVNRGGDSTTMLFSGPDNIAFDNEHNLWVMQEGGGAHILMVHADHNTATNPHIDVFGNTPLGCEPTGITFSPDGKFLFVSFEHPDTNNTMSQMDVAGKSFVNDRDLTIVVARKEFLGTPSAINEPTLSKDITLLNLYPNPSSSILHITLDSRIHDNIHVKIFDLAGQEVYTQQHTVTSGSNDLQLDLAHLAGGNYLVEVVYKDTKRTLPFAKQ